MAPKKKVVKLDPIPEVIPDAAAPVQEPEQAPEPVVKPDPDDEIVNLVNDGVDDANDGVDDADDADGMDDMDDMDGMDDDFDDELHTADLFDVMSGLFVSRDGDTITDVLTTISDSLDTHNKLMYKLIKVLESKK